MLKDTKAEETLFQIVASEPTPAPKKKRRVTLGRIKKLHKLLALAIGDFEKVLADKKYGINMDVWHDSPQSYRATQVCEVCLGGSVIAKTLKLDPREDAEPDRFAPKIEHRLYALNSLRMGSLADAYRFIRSTDVAEFHGVDVPGIVYSLDDKWEARMGSGDAYTRAEGRALLRKLKAMHKDLEAANL